MSVKTVGHYINKHNVNLASKKLADPISTSQTWTRNMFWNPISASANSIVGLYAIWPGGGNFFAFTGAGNYTIDYGDGTTTNYSSDATAYYEYNYNNSSLDGTDYPIYYEEATYTFYHGEGYIENGTLLKFYNNDFATDLKINHPYYVVNSDVDQFQVSETPGGSPSSFTGDGYVTLLPYKLVTVTITPQVGQNLTSANFFVKHNQAGLVNRYCTGWLELKINCPNLTSLTISGSSTAIVGHNILENVILNDVGTVTSLSSLMHNCHKLSNFELNDNDNTVTNMSSMFNSCFGLTTVPLFNTSSVTTMSSMFSNCRRLIAVPLFDTSSVTDMSAIFSSCSSLTTIPLFNTSSVTNMNNMFNSCQSLTAVPLFNTSSVTSMNNMFSFCNSLTTVPLFNTSSVTNMGSMFFSCSSLTTIPLLDTSSVTDMSGMFNGCQSLTAVPLFNTSSVTTMSSMFASCSSLFTVPLFNTSIVTTMNSMFSSCQSLTTIPLFNTSSVTNMGSMFAFCSSLTTIPLLNTSSVTNINSMFRLCYSLIAIPALNVTAVPSSSAFNLIFNACSSLSKIEAEDFRFTFNIASCKLSATELNAIYTRLPTVTGQTITVTGNYGTASDDPSIATAKGWTVTG